MSKLFLGNIPNSFSDNDIAQWVESFGFPVVSVEIIKDRATGVPRGFGFVRLSEEGRLGDAVRLLHGELMGGRVITANEANPLNGIRRAS